MKNLLSMSLLLCLFALVSFSLEASAQWDNQGGWCCCTTTVDDSPQIDYQPQIDEINAKLADRPADYFAWAFITETGDLNVPINNVNTTPLLAGSDLSKFSKVGDDFLFSGSPRAVEFKLNLPLTSNNFRTNIEIEVRRVNDNQLIGILRHNYNRAANGHNETDNSGAALFDYLPGTNPQYRFLHLQKANNGTVIVQANSNAKIGIHAYEN